MVNTVISEMLRNAYARKKKQNPLLSIQAIANRAGLSRPFMSQILSGQRTLSVGAVEKVAAALDLDHEQRAFLYKKLLNKDNVKGLTDLPESNARVRRIAGDRQSWQLQSKEKFSILSNWVYLAVVNTTLLKKYDGTNRFIAERLNLPLAQINEAVDKLVDIGLLEKNKLGVLQKSIRFGDFSSNADKKLIRQYHHSTLGRAKQELETRTSPDDLEERLIFGYTLTVPKSKISWAKQEIREFYRALSDRLTEDDAEEVYQLSSQFFPLTRQAP